MWAIFNDYNCHSCTRDQRLVRGHEVEVSGYNVLGYRIKKCPLLISSQLDKFYFRLCMDYRKGILPNDGGGLKQPWKFYRLMSIVENVINTLEKEAKSDV